MNQSIFVQWAFIYLLKGDNQGKANISKYSKFTIHTAINYDNYKVNNKKITLDNHDL